MGREGTSELQKPRREQGRSHYMTSDCDIMPASSISPLCPFCVAVLGIIEASGWGA